MLDTTPPETTLDTFPSDPSESPTATFTFSSNEPNVNFACNLDNTFFTACESPLTIPASGLGTGVHNLKVRATDQAGNTDPTPVNFTWAIHPNTTIDTFPPNPSSSPNASFTFSSNQPGVDFTCSLDGSIFGFCDTPLNITGLANGSHTLQVKAQDTALGLADPTPASYTWVINVTPPVQEGCSHGFWKNNPSAWGPTGYSTGQKLNTVFNISGSLGHHTLLQALNFGGGSSLEDAKKILLRQAVAAVLNAAHPNVNYPMTPQEVIAAVNTALASNNRNTILNLASSLEAKNNLRCPLERGDDDDDRE